MANQQEKLYSRQKGRELLMVDASGKIYKVNWKEEYALYEVKRKKQKNIRRRGQNHWIIKVNIIEKQSIKTLK